MPPPTHIVTLPPPPPLPCSISLADSMVSAPDPPEVSSQPSTGHEEVADESPESSKPESQEAEENKDVGERDSGENDSETSQLDDDDDESDRLAKKVYAVSVRWERAEAARIRPPSDSSGPVVEHKPFLTLTMEDFNRLFCCCARRVGSMFFLLERKDGSPIVVAGPCWPFCTFVTVPLIVVLSGLVGYFIVSNPNSGLPWWFALVYYPIVAFVLIVLSCVSCRDPGLMERVTDEEAAESGWFWNEQVGSYRPAGAMYCRECKALVYDYDHVCPWTGTAIGKGNMIPFKVFVFSVNVLCYLSVGLVIWQILDNVT